MPKQYIIKLHCKCSWTFLGKMYKLHGASFVHISFACKCCADCWLSRHCCFYPLALYFVLCWFNVESLHQSSPIKSFLRWPIGFDIRFAYVLYTDFNLVYLFGLLPQNVLVTVVTWLGNKSPTITPSCSHVSFVWSYGFGYFTNTLTFHTHTVPDNIRDRYQKTNFLWRWRHWLN